MILAVKIVSDFAKNQTITLSILSHAINFRCFQTERVCRRHSQFNANGRQVENTVAKGEIICYEQLLLFPLYFQKTCTADTEKPGLVWERVKQ